MHSFAVMKITFPMRNLNDFKNKIIHAFSSMLFLEKVGILVLVLITLLVALLPYFFEDKMTVEKYNYENYKKQIAEARGKIHFRKQDKDLSFQHSKIEDRTLHLNPFPFNPNEMNYNMGKALGLRDKQIQSIINYLQKGGQFHTKKDFKKMYLISEEEFEVLQPYILLPDSLPPKQSVNIPTEKMDKPRKKIELNSADSLMLLSIKGIGPTFAHRILAYRNKLGGFWNVYQLLEIKGMDSSKLAEIKDQITINPYLIKKININKADFNDLKKHPYISYNLALSLVNYRNIHGDFKSIDDLKNLKLMTKDLFEKLQPYMTTSK